MDLRGREVEDVSALAVMQEYGVENELDEGAYLKDN